MLSQLKILQELVKCGSRLRKDIQSDRSMIKCRRVLWLDKGGVQPAQDEGLYQLPYRFPQAEISLPSGLIISISLGLIFLFSLFCLVPYAVQDTVE